MAKVRISALTAIAAVALSASDVVAVVDTSGPVTNKATMAQLRTALFAGGAGYTATDPLTAGALSVTTGAFSGVVNANAGVQIGGAATLGTTATALLSFESPVTRIYTGDGTGYSTRFSQRVGSVTTDLVTITDTGNVTIAGLLTASANINVGGGHVAVSGGANPYLSLDDGTAPGFVQVVSGDINLSPRAGKGVTVSGGLAATGNVSAAAGAFTTGITQYGEDTAIIIDAAAGNARLGLVKRSGLAPCLAFRTDNFTINRVTAGSLVSGTQSAVLTLAIADGAATFAGTVTVSGGVIVSATPALSGTIRLGNTQVISARNVTNSGDVALIGLDAANVIQLGGHAATQGALDVVGALTATSGTFSGGVAVTGGGITAGSLVKTSNGGVVLSGATGSSFDFILASPAGGDILEVPTGTINVQFTGTVKATSIVTVNRASAAGLLGYYAVTRVGAPLYYIGQDASDRGAILNAAASAANLWWDDVGNFTMRGGLTATSITASGGFAASGGAVYAGGDLGFTVTTASQNVGVYSLSTSAPVMLFDHRATSNTGSWQWRNGTGGANTQMTLASDGSLTLSSALSTGSTITSGASVVAAAPSAIVFSGRTQLTSPADGILLLRNNAGTDFTRLQFGGTTASFPALKRSTTSLLARLADDSGDAELGALGFKGQYVNFTSLVGTAKIIGGSTGTSLRNNADSADNLLIADAGNVTGRAQIIATTHLTSGATSAHSWNGRSQMFSPVDGKIQMADSTGTAFTMLQFGGTTSAFPALKRSASVLHVRLADDSGFTDLFAGNLWANGVGLVLGPTGGTAAVYDKSGTTVSTTATIITSPFTGSVGGIGVVRGSDGVNRFTDLVFYDSVSATAVSSKNTAGSPPARTYSTDGAGFLKLALASGTFSVGCIEMRAITTS
jgi:fibronectin-binding autotransporter adhesin